MIRNVRARTTAEIVMWSSHVTGKTTDPREVYAKESARTRGLRAIAAANDCLFVEVEHKWLDRMIIENLTQADLLYDGTHMRADKTHWMSDFIIPELVRVPGAAGVPDRTGKVEDSQWKNLKRSADGSYEFDFSGNRIVAVSDGTGDADASATFLLDGKPLAEHRSLWVTTHVKDPQAPAWDRPSPISEVRFCATPVEEDWTFTILPTSATNALPIRYSVKGSVTGEDGEGRTDRVFCSKSGRCVITPEACPIVWQSNWLRKKPPQPGKTYVWKTAPMFAKEYKPTAKGAETLVLQGCANCRHSLRIVPNRKDAKLGIAALRVYAPPVQRSWSPLWEDDTSYP